VKKRGDRSHTRGHGARAPAWTALQVLIAPVPAVSSVLARTRHPSLRVHPLAIGHPQGLPRPSATVGCVEDSRAAPGSGTGVLAGASCPAA
jgi:hypothetical protein